MPKYLLVKHYRGGPDLPYPVPAMNEWDPADRDAHMAFLSHVNTMLRQSGEWLDAQALSPEQEWVRYDGPDAEPVRSDGPHPDTADLVAGWYGVQVDSYERAVELAAYVSSEPGPGGRPLYEWIQIREILDPPDDF